MTKPRVVEVSSLRDFTRIVEEALNATRRRTPDSPYNSNWYRGHGSERSYRLLPSLYRHPKKRKLEDLLTLEREMLDDFRRHSVLHPPPSVINLTEAFGTLFYMQHHGVPTRLLDWTSNPFIALYFALIDDSKRKKAEGASVWILDPVGWNSVALIEIGWGSRGPARLADDALTTYQPKADYSANDLKQMYPLPVAILGVANTHRMFAQKGVFTVFGKKTMSMEDLYDKETVTDKDNVERAFPSGCLQKLVIPAKKISGLLESLIAIGYTDSVSYPDLQGLASEIKRLHGFPA